MLSSEGQYNIYSEDVIPYSNGGLYVPTEEFMKTLEGFEEMFQSFHGTNLNKGTDPIGQMSLFLSACYPDMPGDVVSLYSKTRFFIRLKHLNKMLLTQEKTYKKRHMTHIAQLRD